MKTSFTYEEAVEHFGSPAAMARRIGIKPQAIYQWGGEIPELRQFQIDKIILSDLAEKAALEDTAA